MAQRNSSSEPATAGAQTGHSCRICANPQDNRSFTAREMMFGTKERFEYFQCGQCDCLQIAEVPANLSDHYPPHYHRTQAEMAEKTGIPAWIGNMDARLLLGPMLKSGLPSSSGVPKKQRLFEALTRRAVEHYFPPSVTPDSRVMDVGCGEGAFLHDLKGIGFKNLLGVDRYFGGAPARDGVEIRRGTLDEVQPAWDFIMFHHSFEHLPDPLESLRSARRLLAPGGSLMLRIPIVSEAWKQYGIDWIQLDAPRHLFLFSPKSLRLVAEAAGFEVSRILYDSTAFQYLGSRQYQKDIPLVSDRSFAVNMAASPFSPLDFLGSGVKAMFANWREQGDQAAFYLVPR